MDDILGQLESTFKALESSEQRFRAIAQSAIDAMISADANGNILFWNLAATEIFGYSESEVMGKPLSMLIPRAYREKHNQGLKRYLDTRETHIIGSIVEVAALHKEGHEFPIELSLSTWESPDGIFFNGIIRDITRRKEAEAKLRSYADELQARNEELLAYDRTIAHDLKAPLSVIITYLDLITNKHGNDLEEQILSRLKHVQESGKRMEEMIEQLLWLATIRDTQEAISTVAMQPVIENMMTRLHDRIDKENVQIIVEPELPDVAAHALWIEEVISNLVSNAIKYKGKDNVQPRITIRGARHGDQVRYEIEDNGLGLSPEDQENVFDMFSRTHTQEARGFGLGLSIVSKIINRLNGQVGVESEPGKGSTFWFTLPSA